MSGWHLEKQTETQLRLGLAHLLTLETSQGHQGAKVDSSGARQSDLQSDQSLGSYVENSWRQPPGPT